MIRPPRGRRATIFAALAALASLLAAGAAILSAGGRERPLAERTAAERPALMLLTSLPLLFGEGFSLEGGGSPALDALERRYRVVPISVTASTELEGSRLLLMAHPQAQPAEALVDLDRWVRGGGRLLLLADPALDWHSERPLGDPLRPPPAFADTGLLAHWGLRLDTPEERGPRKLVIGRFEVLTASPGTLHGQCAISAQRLVARCALGRGRATIVADADFLNVPDLDGPTRHNLDALLDELARLEK